VKARVTIPGRPEALTGVVSQVPPQFDAMSRTMKVRLELDNPGALLRPDMAVDVELAVERPAALSIPAEALVDSGLRKTVFVEQGEGIFEPRAVETGWRSGGRVEVVRGLEAGDRIVLAGTFLVDSESQLKAAAEGVHAVPTAPAASATGPTPARDPICNMEVDETKARAAGRTAEHHGKHFVFCSDACRTRFLADPDKYAEAGHEHGAAQAAGARP
jgi:Cu(I)/Ag(I) efflux system membrane fusion protein